MTNQDQISRPASIVGGKQQDFAKEFGLHQSELSNILGGKRAINNKLLNLLLDNGYSVDWLLTGKGTMLLDDTKTVEVSSPQVVDSAGSGIINYAGQELTTYEVPEHFLQGLSGQQLQKIALVRIVGDSMAPDINAGDVAILDSIDINAIKDGCVYMFNMGDDILIKRLQKIEEGLLLVSSNTNYENVKKTSKELKEENFTLLGRFVVAFTPRIL